jgi:hypothetical protein
MDWAAEGDGMARLTNGLTVAVPSTFVDAIKNYRLVKAARGLAGF